jgi:ABC-type Zn uptake system ZnuABC Zn-binding protein ZnuA
MTLSEKQQTFALNVSKLIEYINDKGYACTFGEAYRPEALAALYAKTGAGIKNSLHCQRLAIDLMIFKDGKYLTDSKDYEFAGIYWEALNTENAWGGRFKDKNGKPAPDGNHFSRAHNGVK